MFNSEPARVGVETEHLRTAVKRQEMFLRYQPKLDLHAGCISGVEALIRWRHPLLGVLEPERFIPLAEQTGVIAELGAWTINEACQQLKHWKAQGRFSGSVAVNVSVLELGHAHFVDIVRDAMGRHGVAPGELVLEITESCAMADPEHTLPMFRTLDEIGVRLSLDDFGMGYSSLARLKGLPISEVKVDRGFITEIERCPQDAAIVTAIITMAQALGASVVAEGVETIGQLTTLARLGCRTVQGYFVGRPMAPDDLIHAVAELGNGHG